MLAVATFAHVVHGEDWPKDYVVAENSTSPDGHYGVLIASKESVLNDGGSGSTIDEPHVIYLADLVVHHVLGKVERADYFQGQNHAGLRTSWAEDSSWCVIENDERFGFASISIVEPKGDRFVQTDVGQKITKALAAAITKQTHQRNEDGGDASPFFRLTNDRKLRVRAVSTTDPKQLNPKHAGYAFFQGTFDLSTRKWVAADARPLSADAYSDWQDTLDDFESQLKDMTFESAADKAEWLDQRMNEVYREVRAILPAARFARIKDEQVAWLKTRDAANSPEEKAKLTEERLKALQALLW